MIMTMNKLFVAICMLAVIFHVSEQVIFTAAGFMVDKAIAFLVFKKFLAIHAMLFGKRSIESDENGGQQQQRSFTSEQYLTMAASMDSDKCLPVAVCAAMARSREITENRSRFDDMVIKTFESKILQAEEGFPNSVDMRSPLTLYIEAAKFGRNVGVIDACRQVSASCKFSIEELRRVTNVVSDYNL